MRWDAETVGDGLVPADELVRRHAMYGDEARTAGRSEAEIEQRMAEIAASIRLEAASPTGSSAPAAVAST